MGWFLYLEILPVFFAEVRKFQLHQTWLPLVWIAMTDTKLIYNWFRSDDEYYMDRFAYIQGKTYELTGTGTSNSQ